MKTLEKFVHPLEHLCVPPFENYWVKVLSSTLSRSWKTREAGVTDYRVSLFCKQIFCAWFCFMHSICNCLLKE